MKHKLLCTLGLIVLGWAVFAAIPAEAVNGIGTYYATPSWDQTLSSNVRFTVLTNMSGQAVLDKETGLVWEKSPSSHLDSWENAQNYCNLLTTGNRMGWRLPTLQELESLVDPSQASPALPVGHPFSNVDTAGTTYWSATTGADPTTTPPPPGWAWALGFISGGVAPLDKTSLQLHWCVRGGKGVDPQ